MEDAMGEVFVVEACPPVCGGRESPDDGGLLLPDRTVTRKRIPA